MSAPIELLKRVPLFQGLDEKYLKSLSAEFTERKFSEGQELTAEGSGGAGFFVIESGTAKVTVDGEDRRTLGPGDYYGEIALLDPGVRTATVTAETPMTLAVLTAAEFSQALDEVPTLAQKILRGLARRVHELSAEDHV